MEAQEEFMGSNDLTQMVKGKRTKRQRSSSPYKTVASSSSSGCGAVGGEGIVEYYGSISSGTATSSDHGILESTEEEEDMANCLILLAQGGAPTHTQNGSEELAMKLSTGKFSDILSTPTVTKTSLGVYECKTCNRSFPSFQALGGHRASHKKTRAAVEEKKTLVVKPRDDSDDCHRFNKSSHGLLSLQIVNTNNISNNKGFSQGNCKNKIHECSICGSEFTSGQALGGHMRRHKANTGNLQVAITTDTNVNIRSSVTGEVKTRNILSLDLNLPAPEDDHHHREPPTYQFSSTKQALVFPAPALVDCHY